MANKPSSYAEALESRTHNRTIYWLRHGVPGHGVLHPEIVTSVSTERYLEGESVGNLQGEHVNVDVLTRFARHPDSGLGLGPDYVVTELDVDDVKYLDINGAPAYRWIEREALRLGIDPRGDQAPDGKPDVAARQALEKISGFLAAGLKPEGKGGGVWKVELRKLREQVTDILRQAGVLLLLVALFSAGCRSAGAWFRAVTPGGTTAADQEFDAVVAAPAIPLLATLAANVGDPRAQEILTAAHLLGFEDPIGVGLLLSTTGQEAPRLVRCVGDLEARCRVLKVNTPVHVTGQLDGASWRLSSIRALD